MNPIMTTDDEHLLRLVAKLYYENGLSQEEIAQTTGISRTKASRLLTKARNTGVVQIRIQGYDPRNRDLEEKLKRQLGLHHAIVINTPRNTTTTHIRRTIGYLAAPFISELLQEQMVIGLAGGRTISELIRHIEPPSMPSGGTILALMGHIGPTVTGIDALELSYLLAHCFGRTQYTLNAPAFSSDPVTRDVFMNHEQVSSVFKLFSSLGLAMVGIGALEESAWIERGVITPSDLELLRQAGASGEMVGRFFDHNGQECDTPYRERVISISLSELKNVPEVIAVTNGAVRSQAILAARYGNLIKSLVIDDLGARAVLEKIE